MSEERARFAVHPGDLLVCEGGAIGRAAIWHGPAEIGYQKALHRVRSRGDLDLRWLRYLLEQYDNQGVLAARATGSTIKHLPQSQLRRLPIPMPDESEQRRIVDALEDHLSRLDAGLGQLRAAQRRNRSLRDAALRGELLGRRWPGDRLPCGMPAADVDDGVLSDLPAGWEWRRLQDVADVVGGVTKDASKQGHPAFVEVPYLRVANVQRGRLDLRTISRIRVPPAKLERLRLEPGDVLLNEGGDRDKLGRGWVWAGEIEDCITQNHVFRARPRPGKLHPKLCHGQPTLLADPGASATASKV